MSKAINLANYDDLRLISKALENEGESFAQLYSVTRQKMNLLRSEWYGDAAKAFFNEADNTLLPAVQRVSKALIEAQSILDQIGRIVHDADVETATYFRDFAASADGASESPQGGSLFVGLGSTLSNLYAADKSFLDIMGDLIGDNKLLPGLGKYLEIIKIGKFKLGGFDLLSMGLDTWGDMQKPNYDGNLGRTLAINGLNTTINAGITATEVGGVILLANSGIQMAGNLEIAAEKAMYSIMAPDDISRQILLDQSQLKSDALEKMDLGNITKSFSTSVVDGFLFTNQGRNDLLNTAKSTVNVFGGAADWIIDNNIITPANKDILFIDQTIQSLPLSNSIKQATSLAVQQDLQLGKNLMQGLANWTEWR